MLKQKGLSFGLQEMIAMVLVIISFIFLIQFMTQSKSGLDTKLSAFCEKNPESFLCDGKAETINLGDKIAAYSTEALTCAVNSVATESEQDCLKKFHYKKEAAPENKEEDKNKFKPVGIECETENSDAAYSIPAFNLNLPPRKVKNCDVKNFNLPQDLTKLSLIGNVEITPSNWIKYFGDPQYIVYWQKFPIEQDTWSYRGDWMVHAGIIAVAALPPGKVLKFFGKIGFLNGLSKIGFLAKTADKIAVATREAASTAERAAVASVQAATARSIAQEAAKKAAQAEALVGGTRLSGIEAAEKAAQAKAAQEFATKTATEAVTAEQTATKASESIAGRASKAIQKASTESLLKESLKQAFLERISSEKIKIGTTILGLELANYAAQWADSVAGKYITKTGKIVLKKPTPLFDKKGEFTEFGIVSGAEQIPIMLYFRPGALNDISPAHLASPCKINSLPVRKAAVLCKKYSFNKETNELICDGECDGKGMCQPPQYLQDVSSGSQDRTNCQWYQNNGFKLDNKASQDFLESIRGLQGSPIPKELTGYYKFSTPENKPTALIQKGLSLEIYGGNGIIGDRLIFEKDPSIVFTEEKKGTSFGDQGFTGSVKYDKTAVQIEKICYDPYVGSQFRIMDCKVGLKISGECADNSETCQKLNVLKSESASETIRGPETINYIPTGRTVTQQSSGFNKIIRYKIDSERKDATTDNGRIIEVINDKYMITFVDSDYDNKFERIELSVYDSMPEDGKEPKSLVIEDTNSGGIYQTVGAADCKTEAVYIDMIEAKKNEGKQGYCTQDKSKGKIAREGATYYGGYAAAGAGVVALIASGFGAPVGVGLATSLIGYGLTSVSVSDFSTTFTGGWPNN